MAEKRKIKYFLKGNRCLLGKGSTLLNLAGFLIPFQLFAIPVFGIGIEPAFIAALLFILIRLGKIVINPKTPFKKPDGIELWLLFFSSCVLISLIWNSEKITSESKATLEYGRLLIMVIFFLCAKRDLEQNRNLWELLRFVYFGMFIVALLGVWQFININTPLNIRFLSDWSWATNLNPSIGGWGMAGGRMAYLGPINRISSFAHEPSHLALFLVGVIGLSLLVLFCHLQFPFGERNKNFVLAATILFAFSATLSVVGLISFFLMILLYLAISRNALFKITLFMFFLLFPIRILLGASESGAAFIEKASTLLDVFVRNDYSVTGAGFSTLTLWSHSIITMNILSDHPFWGYGIGNYFLAYQEYSPNLTSMVHGSLDELLKMNINDANSLLLRMVSETGLISTTFFVLFLLAAFKKSYRAIRRTGSTLPRNTYLSMIGLMLSAFGYLISHLTRMGAYHYIELWLLLAMISVVSGETLVVKETANE